MPAIPVDNLRGALWHVAACLMFSLMAALAKLLGDRLPSIEVAFGRAFLGLLLILPLLLAQGPASWRTHRLWLHGTRAALGNAALICGFYAVTHLPLAEATGLSFTRPLFQVILAALVLREVVGPHRWTATVVGFLGVLLMLDTGATMDSLGGSATAVALLGALCVAVVGITLRRLAQEERHLTILFYLGVVGSLMTGLPTAFLFVMPTPAELGLLLVLAVAGVLGQACLMRGFRIGEASALAVVDYTRLPFSAALGLLLFLELPDLKTVAGALIIAGATLYIARREAGLARRARHEAGPARRRPREGNG